MNNERPRYRQHALNLSFEAQPAPNVEQINARQLRRLHRSLAPYVDIPTLRRLVAERGDVYAALRTEQPSEDVRALLNAVAALLHPDRREQIRSPRDIAGVLLAQMSHLDQEELRTVLLDTKNRVQDVVMVYRGSVNAAMIRVGEVYKAALRRNSVAIILAHNHPSGDVTVSPEDILVTQRVVDAGRLLDVECVDHLIIGKGVWTSLREQSLGFAESRKRL